MKKKQVIILAFFLLGVVFNKAQAFTAPNDQYFSRQWYLSRVFFDRVWDKNIVDRNIVVAVIDSGININHPDLVDSIWANKFEVAGNGIDDDRNGFIDDVYGWNFVDNIPDPRPVLSRDSNEDGLNHGTMIAGIIAANVNNDIGISGLAPQVKIMSLKALNDRGEGRVSDVIRAIDYAVNNRADIINLSFSGEIYNQGLKEAVERAHRSGVIVVAAAGNNNMDLDVDPLYPACFTGNNNENIVIAVASTDTLDQKATFSSYGENCVDISAPGISFFSSYYYDVDNDKELEYHGYWSGTSMSAAVVSGSLAYIKSVNPGLSTEDLLDILLRGSDNIDDLNPFYRKKLGIGRVNLASSINWAIERWDNLSGSFLISLQKHQDEFSDFNNINLVDRKGVSSFTFHPYGDDFTGSVNMATYGRDTIIVGAGEGQEPQVKIFDRQGNLKNEFLAYNQNFRGGVRVAVADLTGNGEVNIITAPGPGGGPHVRVFDFQGNVIGQFMAYNQNFRGGVSIAVADLTGNGEVNIITAPGPGGGPHVKVFDFQGSLLSHFMAYDADFRGGVQVTAGNIYGKNSQGFGEIVVAPGKGMSPEIKVFSFFGKKIKGFMAYDYSFKNGVNIAVGDFNKDGLDEIITGAGPGGAPHVRAFNGSGGLLASFYALDVDFSGGVMVGFIEFSK